MDAKELMKLAAHGDKNIMMSNTKEKMMDTDESSEEKKEESKSEEKKEEKKDEEKTASSCGSKGKGFKQFQKFKGGRQ